MIRTKVIFILLSIFFFTACTKEQPSNPHLDKEYWKKQALTDILPFWTQHAVDSVQGAFFGNLDANWHPVDDTLKYPSMISRHLFSYAAAYLMSGKDEYLDIARETKNYLLAHAWDEQYGGWYDALSTEGAPLQMSKSTFVQVYVITGLAMYYFVTHDAEVLQYVDRSNAWLETHAWDPSLGGYYDVLAQDGTVSRESKSFSPQLAPVSGYLLYLYMGTRNKKYLEQAERIMDTMLRHMIDPKSGWVLESFDKQWNYQPGKQGEAEINVGHNIEAAWMLLRLYLLNNRTDYLQAGKAIADSVHQYGFNAESGFWAATTGNHHPELRTNFTHWWIQAYGNMFDLCLNRLYPEANYISTFSKGAAFWDTYFLDQEKGDTHLSVWENGEVKEARKANRFKASYHSVEHSLLNYLYLGCWAYPEPITLYFKITSTSAGEALYPVPVEMLDAQLTDIRINDNEYPSSEEFISLPALEEAKVSVTFHR